MISECRKNLKVRLLNSRTDQIFRNRRRFFRVLYSYINYFYIKFRSVLTRSVAPNRREKKKLPNGVLPHFVR